MKNDVLQALFSARDEVSNMLIQVSPGDGGNQGQGNQQMQTLLGRYNSLTGAINQVIAANFNDLASGLQQAEDNLQAQVSQLQKINQTLANVANVVKAIDGVLQIVGQIVKIATGGS